jgi:cytochrome b561
MSDTRRYPLHMQLFHWAIAAAVLFMLGLGFYMDGLPVSLQKLSLYGLHKSVGMTVLALALLRILARTLSDVPPLHAPGKYGRTIVLAAQAGHFALYFMLLAMPLSGWTLSSAAGLPVSVFGLFAAPDLVPPNAETRKIAETAHEIGAFVLCGLILVHVGAVVFHHLVLKDRLILRMLPAYFHRRKRHEP